MAASPLCRRGPRCDWLHWPVEPLARAAARLPLYPPSTLSSILQCCLFVPVMPLLLSPVAAHLVPMLMHKPYMLASAVRFSPV